jgi:hypothetical protein
VSAAVRPGRAAARRTVLFFRDFRRFTGGHLNVWHYFQYVAGSPRFVPRVSLSPASASAENPWATLPPEFFSDRAPAPGDVLFLGGLDWRRLTPNERDCPPGPIVNLIQHLRHADPRDRRFEFLQHRAVRICISPEVAAALTASKRVQGPIFTIPCAVDVDRLPEANRPTDVVVAAPKAPALGRRVASRIHRKDRRVDLIDEFLPRAQFLERIGRANVGVMLPHRTEGFFLPAIETMALGTILVCPDCTANRSFCLHGINCFRPDYEEDAIVAAAETALGSLPELAGMVGEGFATAQRHSLEAERDAFLAVLDRIDELWAANGAT